MNALNLNNPQNYLSATGTWQTNIPYDLQNNKYNQDFDDHIKMN